MPRAKLNASRSRRRTGGYSRGEASKTRILEAAIDVFGRVGYEGATTRMIAKRAKVNLGSLQYYFRGKERLYLDCARHIAAGTEANFPALLRMVDSALAPESAPPAEHVEALVRLWAAVADRIIGAGKSTHWIMFVNREQMSPGKAFSILYDRVVKRLIDVFALHVGRILRRPPDSEEVLLQTLALLGPLFFFQRARGVILRTLDWPDLEGERLARALAVLLKQSLHGLDPAGQIRDHRPRGLARIE